MQWKSNATMGQVVVDANQLNHPTNVIIDQQNNSLIIADQGNRRLIRWSRQDSPCGRTIMSDIDCFGLAIHKDGSIYISDCMKNAVRRWKKGETNAPIVAGGNGEGNALNQLHYPTYLFVDDHHTLYVSDRYNHRVMKWMKDAKEGIVVAGGNDEGDRLTQLSFPSGVLADRFGQIYVADWGNDRVLRWREEEIAGIIVVGGSENGSRANQLSSPAGVSYDSVGNLYVVDGSNARVQRFEIEAHVSK